MASVKRVEAFAVVGLLSSCLALALWAEPILRYTASAAAGLHEPGPYVDGVLSRPALPSASSRFLEVER
jgi:multicomponent K+:H+ antiporter subunit D